MPNSNPTTPIQDLPTPTDTMDPDVPGDVYALATALEKKLVMVFNNVTDRSARVTAPTEGMFAYMKDTNTFVVYDGAAWVSAYPAPPTFRSGTTTPANTLGVDGDVYFKY